MAWEDYLHPCRGLHPARPGEVQPGELDTFDPLAQPALGQPGDYVSRLLWLRLGYWLGPLRRQLGRCLGLLGQLDQPTTSAVESLGVSWAALERCVGALEVVCRAGTQARLRDSCAVLTQVLAGYGTCPDLDWLGLPAGMVQANRPLIRLCFRRPVCLPGALERVAAALVDVRPLYQPAAAEDMVALAVASPSPARRPPANIRLSKTSRRARVQEPWPSTPGRTRCFCRRQNLANRRMRGLGPSPGPIRSWCWSCAPRTVSRQLPQTATPPNRSVLAELGAAG